MLATPADAVPVWVGLTIVTAALLGVTLGLPSAPPPDATVLADAVDATAAADVDAVATHDVGATRIRLAPHSVSVRGPGGVSHARLAFGPVTPTANGPLERVLDGASPSSVFDGPADLLAAAARARDDRVRWRRVDRLTVRTVVWGDASVTLVGA